jgi:hypothetical protein
MAYNPSRFIGPVLLTTTNTSLKTFTNRAIVKSILTANTFNGPIAFSLYLVPVGQTPSAANRIFGDVLLSENTTKSTDTTLVINAGESLWASANVTGGVSIMISGVEIV